MAINYGIRPGGLCLAAAENGSSYYPIVRPAAPVIMGSLLPLPQAMTAEVMAPGARTLDRISEWMDGRHLPMVCADDDGDLFVLVIGGNRAAPLPLAAARDLWSGADHVIVSVCHYAMHEFPNLPEGCGVRQVVDGTAKHSLFDVLVGGPGSGSA